MSLSPSISIFNVLVAKTDNHAMTIPITISSKKNKENKTVKAKALLDTGAEENLLIRTMSTILNWKPKS
jgi:hypothetical protein